MTWGGPWVSQAWDGPWDDPADAVAPVNPNPPTGGTLDRIIALAGLLVEIGGLSGVLEITPRLAGIMAIIPPIYRGDDVSFLLTVVDAAGAPTAILGGDEIEVEVKAVIDGPDPALIRKTLGAGVTAAAQSGSTLGQATVVIPGSETDLTPATYWLDVVHTRAGVRTHIIGPRNFPITGVVNRR